MKVVTAVSSAYRSVMLALDNIRVGGDDGLVAHDVDECVRNVGCLACHGMKVTDDEILNIMLHKNKGC
ncbi:L-serine ammonia-lyase, iron-sulfur-dependent, subunit alpha [uncultured Megasphaera sp.]